ncbi:MAG: plasmid stabilization protein, partial [Firmicutes bacterium]|nr:plasmid stabilization protein [Bacillota bacterium]
IVQTPWRIIYRVLEDKVVILAVIDASRNVADVLLERILGTS